MECSEELANSSAFCSFQINFYFIQKEGHHEEAWAILYYVTML